MTWETVLSPNHRLVEVSCVDNISANDLTMLAIEIAFFIKKHASNRVLIDLSKAHAEFLATDVQDLLDIYAEYRVPKITQSAIVAPDRKSRKEMSALMPQLQEYGYQLMFFNGADEARKWLND